MAVLFRRPRLIDPRIVPTVPVELDRAHPLASGLYEHFVPGVSLNGLVGNISGVASGSVSVATGAGGPAAQFNGGRITLSSNAATLSTAPFTITALIIPSSNTANNTIVANPLLYNGLEFRHLNDGRLDLVDQNNKQIAVSTGAVPNGVLSCVSITYDAAGNYVFYKNGVSIGSGLQYWNIPSSDLCIGYAGNGDNFVGQIIDVKFYKRVVSASEVAWLNAEPFAMLRPIQRRRYYTATVAGGGTWSVTQAETTTATDAPSSIAALIAARAETAAAAEATASLAALLAARSETAAAVESTAAGAAAYPVSIAEAATIGDAATSTGALLAAQAETSAAADSLSSAAALLAAAIDALGAADAAATGAGAWSVSAAEVAAASETGTAGILPIALAAIEAVAAIEASNAAVASLQAAADMIAATDAAGITHAALQVAVAEAITVSDAIASAADQLVRVAEAAGALDAALLIETASRLPANPHNARAAAVSRAARAAATPRV